MSRADTHVVRLERANPSSTWTRWVCTCGRRSRLFGFAGFAEQAARPHLAVYGGHMDPFRRT
jgi:hypothetical protein